MTPEALRAGALTGLVVLDTTQWLSGPYATQILADLGATVIKVESLTGDVTRSMPPYFVHGDSAYYHSANRSKKSVALDLKQPAGRVIFHDLARRVDVVLDNMRPGVPERLQIDYPTLSKLNPRLIGCSITGFGQQGPYRNRPAFDMVVQALSGVMSLTGEVGGRAVRVGVPLGDVTAGMYAAIGILAALTERALSGKGQHIDISMLDCQLSLLSYLGEYHLVSGMVPTTQGRGHVSIPTYRSFLAGDDHELLICANTEKMWQNLCIVLNYDELGDDPRFRTQAERLAHKDDLIELLEARFRTRPAAEWLSRLESAGVPAAPLNSVAEALQDPQALAREMVTTTTYPDGQELRLLGNPVKLSRTVGPVPQPPPALGADTWTILAEFLQYPASHIEALVAAGIIRCRDQTDGRTTEER